MAADSAAPRTVRMAISKLRSKPDSNLPRLSKKKLDDLIEEARIQIIGPGRWLRRVGSIGSGKRASVLGFPMARPSWKADAEPTCEDRSSDHDVNNGVGAALPHRTSNAVRPALAPWRSSITGGDGTAVRPSPKPGWRPLPAGHCCWPRWAGPPSTPGRPRST